MAPCGRLYVILTIQKLLSLLTLIALLLIAEDIPRPCGAQILSSTEDLNINQLVTNKVVATVCDTSLEHKQKEAWHPEKVKLRAKWSDVGTIDEDKFDYSWPELDKLLATLTCDEGEKIAVVGLEDHLSQTSKINNTQQLEGDLAKICDARLEKLHSSIDSLDLHDRIKRNILDESSNSKFIASCRTILNSEKAILSDLTDRCNGLQTCKLIEPSSHSLFKQNCLPLYMWKLNPQIQVSYKCIPLEARFESIEILYEEPKRQISCSEGHLLYLNRATFIVLKNSTASLRDDCHYGSCRDSSVSQSFMATDDIDEVIDLDDYLDQFYDFNLRFMQIGASIVDHDNETLIVIKSGHAREKTKSKFDSCESLELIPMYILEACHAQRECSFNLHTLVSIVSEVYPCDYNNYNWRTSMAQVDLLCINESKLIMPKDDAKTKTALIKTARVLQRKEPPSYDILNVIDYVKDPILANEFGSVKLSHLRSTAHTPLGQGFWEISKVFQTPIAQLVKQLYHAPIHNEL